MVSKANDMKNLTGVVVSGHATNSTRFIAAFIDMARPLLNAIKLKDELLGTSGVDKTLQVKMGMICQNLWRDTFGAVVLANGNALPNAQQRLKDSNDYIAQIPKNADGTLKLESDKDYSVVGWYQTNKERLAFNVEVLDAFKGIYFEMFGEHWTPREDTRKANERPVINDVMKSKLLEAFTHTGH